MVDLLGPRRRRPQQESNKRMCSSVSPPHCSTASLQETAACDPACCAKCGAPPQGLETPAPADQGPARRRILARISQERLRRTGFGASTRLGARNFSTEPINSAPPANRVGWVESAIKVPKAAAPLPHWPFVTGRFHGDLPPHTSKPCADISPISTSKAEPRDLAARVRFR